MQHITTHQPKQRPAWWGAYVALLVVIAVATLVVEVGMLGHSHGQASAPLAADTSCAATKQTIDIQVTDSALMPASITAHLCDKLAFHNATGRPMEIAFGPHEKHIEYPGLSDEATKPGDTIDLTLVTKGTFPIHNHANDAVHGQLIVAP